MKSSLPGSLYNLTSITRRGRRALYNWSSRGLVDNVYFITRASQVETNCVSWTQSRYWKCAM